VSAAQERLLANVPITDTELLPIERSSGRVLAETVTATISLPPFANSAMDGFAIRAADTSAEASTPVQLQVVGQVAAGDTDAGRIGEGEASRIMTGAPLPEGADAVVPFEETTTADSAVMVPPNVPLGASVRPAGLDITPGSVVLQPGSRVGARQIALLAALGKPTVQVYRRPVIGVLTTGDELVNPGHRLEHGQIYNSNSYGLAAAVEELGAVPRILGPAPDDPEVLRSILDDARDCDLLLTSGGVSVGDFDYVKQVLSESGDLDFWRVRMRPGKPLTFGRISPTEGSKGVILLGLPGNPTSTMVTFYVFARPLILKMMGIADPLPEPLTAFADDALDNRGNRETYFRVILYRREGRLRARAAGGQDSSMVLPLARATALARVPADVVKLEAEQPVDVFPFDGWGTD
jgi:molybdopterin molybdotransferase